MEPRVDDAEVSSTSGSPIPAYSPHTQGFPPTSHSLGQSNPFSSSKKVGGAPAPKGNVQSTTGLSSYVLRPSQLEAGLGSNIFTKHVDETKPKLEKKSTEPNSEVVSACTAVEPTRKDADETVKVVDSSEAEAAACVEKTSPIKETDEKKDSLNEKKTDTETETPTPSTNSGSDEARRENSGLRTTSTPVGFVFGSNLNERVENVTKGVANGDATEAKSSKPSPPDQTKRKWEEFGTVTTGEEEESNVMQTSCRLFIFDVENSNWIERGRGLLRLNDRKENEVLHSRLIIRTKGSLRVMLNTPVFPEMIVERSSEKCVKITGQEDGMNNVKVFLIQCSPCDAETLHSALEWRVRTLATIPASDAETTAIQDSKVTIHQGHFDKTSPPKKPKLSE